jgi:hypothetical protein
LTVLVEKVVTAEIVLSQVVVHFVTGVIHIQMLEEVDLEPVELETLLVLQT